MKNQEREELGGVSPDDQSKVRMNVLEMRENSGRAANNCCDIQQGLSKEGSPKGNQGHW